MLENFDLDGILSGLKDFQRRTVDYVFKRLYLDDPPAHRFLIADEVGLGKTLVARGLIARTLDHLRDKVDRIDVIYVCSNAAIAQQNISRLNVLGVRDLNAATRLTLLPEQLGNLARNRVNFVSFTPDTSFNLRSRGGMWSERVLLGVMLREVLPHHERGLVNLLQGGMSREQFRARYSDRRRSKQLNEHLAESFIDRLRQNTPMLDRLTDACEQFTRARRKYPREMTQLQFGLIGELRQLLAHVCVDALEPDLVILDEFQRFKDLIHGESEAAELARTLMTHQSPQGEQVRVVMLSATPYKPLTQDDDAEDNHYRDFLETLRFLTGSANAVSELEKDLREFRRTLFGGTTIDSPTAMRDRIRDRLLDVMVRTERVGSTTALDAMVESVPTITDVQPDDLREAVVTGRIAQAVNSHDPTDYWKSAPFALEFMKEYDLKKKLEQHASNPSDELIRVLESGKSVQLSAAHLRNYRAIRRTNGRYRSLARDTIDRGMWQLLWLPPSLPYVKDDGPHADRTLTKALVFSCWNVVPDAVAALLSYEAERLALGDSPGIRYSQLTQKRSALLRIAIAEGREAGMNALALLYPCVTLAAAIDPLRIAAEHGGPVELEALRDTARRHIRDLLSNIEFPDAPADPQWYWAAPALLDAMHYPDVSTWCEPPGKWAWAITDEKEPGNALLRHVRRFVATGKNTAGLGGAPDDLIDVLVELALGSPAITALRALHRLVPEVPLNTHYLLQEAARVAFGFQSLYNQPETMSLLRGEDEGAYWRVVTHYGAAHNLQAVLDEYVHCLRESLGAIGKSPLETVHPVAVEIAQTVSLRTALLRPQSVRVSGRSLQFKDFSIRTRFAVRYGTLRSDDGQQLNRADDVKRAFNSPFRPFVIASTSIGQEGLDFHPYCHAVYHWNLPGNPVDMEQREGRVHRYKGHAVRKNVAQRFGLEKLDSAHDPWQHLFEQARTARAPHESDLVPYWIYPIEGGAKVERRIPIPPFSKEEIRIKRLQRSLAVYRLAFGQPRQEDLMAYLTEFGTATITGDWQISLQPPPVSLDNYDATTRAKHGSLAASRSPAARHAEPEPIAAAIPRSGGRFAWNEASFMDAVFTAYQQDELDAPTVTAIEKVLDFAMRYAADVGWMQNQTGSFRPEVPSTCEALPVFAEHARRVDAAVRAARHDTRGGAFRPGVAGRVGVPLPS